MDGFQTAEKIRQIEAAGARHTPIVAMTAHALHDEKQRCLDAGMVGQVSKPLSKQALHTAVQQYALPRAVEEMPALPIRGHIGTPAKATTASLVPEPATLPMPSLKSRPLRDDTAALDRLGGDRELLDELIEMYLQSLEPQSAELRRTGASKDLAKLGQLAHSQKGSAGAVGANDARSAASALEISCNEGDEAAAMCWLEELLDALQALREEADMKTAP
jgi:CheY-like chemotaxis protein